jgi:hypothetical protein
MRTWSGGRRLGVSADRLPTVQFRVRRQMHEDAGRHQRDAHMKKSAPRELRPLCEGVNAVSLARHRSLKASRV